MDHISIPISGIFTDNEGNIKCRAYSKRCSKPMFRVLIRSTSGGASNEYPQHMLYEEIP